MALPDFVIIGAAKSGTTALDDYLQQHPSIFMAEKEPRFFAYDPDGNIGEWHQGYDLEQYFKYRTLAQYEALFTEAHPGQVLGEATPLYLESANAASNIHQTIPDVKLIAILRNPVERAISGYMMQIRHGRVDTDITEAFDQEAHYVRASFYYRQVKRYADLFPPEQLRIYLYEDFRRDNQSTLKDIFEYVGVDPSFEPDTSTRRNVSTYPKSKALNKLIMNPTLHKVMRPITPGWLKKGIYNLRKMNMTTPPKVSEETREDLRSIFRDDVLKLQDLIQKDLSGWVQKN